MYIILNIQCSFKSSSKVRRCRIIVNQLNNNGTYRLVGKGGNIGLSIGDEEVLLIDSQFKQLTDKILSAINTRITDKPVKFVINIHWHQDHTGGDENLANNGAAV